MAEERLIRKYANRRLYDAHDSRHVTLDDLRKLIASGQRIKVIDDKSGEDLTRSILLQIIAAQEQFGTPALSTQLLEGIIRFYGNPVQQLRAGHRGAELLLGSDDLQQDAAGQVLAALVVDHFDALAAGDQLAQVIERYVAAVVGVVQAPVGVFAYQAFFGHRNRSFQPCAAPAAASPAARIVVS